MITKCLTPVKNIVKYIFLKIISIERYHFKSIPLNNGRHIVHS